MLEIAKTPVITVITVTLNAQKHLEECIESVINLPYPNKQYIIIDGGSTDNTINIIRKYEKHISIWISEADNGIYDAMNKALNFATGDYIYFLGADDKILPDFASIIKELKDDKTIYYADLSYDGTPCVRHPYTTMQIIRENICHQGIIYPKQVFKHYKFNQTYKIAADWVLNLSLWGDKRFKFHFCPLVIANFSGEGISSHFRDEQFYKDKAIIVKNSLGHLKYYQSLYVEWKRERRLKRSK